MQKSKKKVQKKGKRQYLQKRQLEIRRISFQMGQVLKNKVSYLVLSFICLFLFITLSLVKYLQTRDFSSCSFELVATIIFAFLSSILCLVDWKSKSPRTLLGRKLEKRSSNKRKKEYVLESFLVSLAITSVLFVLIATDRVYVDFYGIFQGNLLVSVLLVQLFSFISIFFFFYAVNFFFGEKRLQKSTFSSKNKKPLSE